MTTGSTGSLWSLPKSLIVKVKHKWYPLYFEHCKIVQNDFGLKAISKDEVIDIPIGICSALILGPGVSVTSSAIRICANSNCIIHWVGEDNTSYYAYSHETSSSNKNAMKQISLRGNRNARLETIKRMFSLRYPEADISGLTIKNMMGIEGVKVKDMYNSLAEKYYVTWTGRKYSHGNFIQNNAINKAISYTNSVLYSFCFSSILSMSYLPSVGFVHKGSMRDFVLDISDLYKERITIEPSFESVGRCREFNRKDLLQKMFREFENIKINAQIPKDIDYIVWENK